MLFEDIEEVIKTRQSKIAYTHGDESLTYAELDQHAGEVAAELHRAGLGPGDRVAIKAEATVAYPAVCVGVWRAGGAVVPLDAALEESELSRFLDLARARFLVTPSVGAPGSSTSRRFGLQQVSGDSQNDRDSAASSDRDMLLVFTSGTTGAPKGVVHTRESTEALVRRHLSCCGLSGNDVILATSLFNTGFGLHSYILEPLVTGAKVVIVHPFLPRVALDVACREGVTWIQTVPAVLKLLSAVKPRPPLPALRTVRLGAATLDAESREEFVAEFGIQPVQGYGMNEVGRIASTTRIVDAPSHRIVGYPEVDIQLFGDDTKPVPTGELGQIGVRSPSMCRPYYLVEDGSQEPLPMCGEYFLTGDLGRLTDEGLLELAGRRKAFILTPRYKVDPHEVEAVLLQHPLVMEAAVVPAPGNAGYESIKAVVAASAPLSSMDLQVFCSERLPMGKCPQIVTFVDRLPRNALGKVEIGKLQQAS